MQKYLSLGVLVLMGVLSIYFYYIHYPIHGENKDYFLIYLLIVGIVYGIYKVIGIIGEKSVTEITPLKLITVFLIQLLIACVCFFAFTTGVAGYGIVLFFKILMFLSAAAFLWMNFYTLGNTALKSISFLGVSDKNIQIMISIGTGFTLYMFGVFIGMSLGLYNLNYVLLLLGASVIVSYKSYIQIFHSLKKSIRSYSHDLRDKASFSEKNNLSLLIDELHYLVITFLISVNLVSVYRPFPIGWDDLGAYMNYPKLLSGAGEHIAMGKIYMWEMYTGIGFLFGSQTFAFYLNTFGGIIAGIVTYLAISFFAKKRETNFDLGLFSVMILLMMPMVIFQLAKDMKLDLGLFSMSVIAFTLFYYCISSKGQKNIGIYGLVGIFIGVAFSIKVTSLLLLLGIFAALFYKKYSIGGFLGFLGMFIGVFSYLNLWSMMNVIIPSDGNSVKILSIVSILLGVLILVGTHIIQKQNSKYIYNFIIQILAILLGFMISLLPWGIKNISEVPAGKNIKISNIIGGYGESFVVEYENIYTEQELQNKQKVKDEESKKSVKADADLGRYFGYEEGVNNYLKLPWNLTFQLNQKGEFTDITYIFFALLPALFLFLPFRKEAYKFVLIGAMILGLVYVIPNPISSLLINIFGKIFLPYGYLIIGFLCLLPLLFFHFALDKTNKISRMFLVNLVFSVIYIGLWTISAFGIVWYGIFMYFSFLFMITLCMLSMQEQKTKESKISMYVVVLIVGMYVLYSSIPHGVTNLRSASYGDYKLGGMSEENALMRFHPEYFNILFELNIGDEYKNDFFIKYRNDLLKILDSTSFADKVSSQIQGVGSMAHLHDAIKQIIRFDLGNESANKQVEELQQRLYEDIIFVSKEEGNTENIHRIGTFLKYYISENNTRFYEDSLLTRFNDYLYDDDFDTVVERYQKLDIGYILLDINAATIDRDPSRNLTQRYEKMLMLATNSNLKLIETDSVCLRVALDVYKKDKNLEKYMDMAAVNYSYKKSSQQKKTICVQEIVKILGDGGALKQYPYLAPYIGALERAKIPLDDKEKVQNALVGSIKNGYKVLFKINKD